MMPMIPSTGIANMAPKGPAIFAPITNERRIIMGCSLKAFPIIFGPIALKMICWIRSKTTKTIRAFVGLVGSETKTTNTAGIIPKIGPIRGIIFNIPAIKEVEAAKLTPKIVNTIQVDIPAKSPNNTWTLKNEAKVSSITLCINFRFSCHFFGARL